MSNLKKLELPEVAIIPAFIRKNKNLTDAVKIYYGELTTLSYKYGYCFATDEQLAEMKEVSIRTIERWNEQLEKEGLIFRETKNVIDHRYSQKFKWIKQRRIFMIMPNSKNVCGTAKFGGSIEPDKNGGSIEPDKNGGINNKQDSKQKTKPKVVVFSSLSKLKISEPLAIKISSKHNEREVDIAVDRCLAWTQRPNDEVGLMTALKDANIWQDKIDPGINKIENEKFLNSLKNLDGKKIDNYMICIGHDYFEISDHMKVRFLAKTCDKDFKIKIQQQLDRLKE